MTDKNYIELTPKQIQSLESQGCSADNWADVKVGPDFNPARVINARFEGTVQLGVNSGSCKVGSVEKPSGIYNAAVINSTVGDNCRISNISLHIANYDIANNVCIEGVGILETTPNATFGNGTQVAVINEAGGRDIPLFDKLTAQFAYLTALYKYKPDLTEKLKTIANNYIQTKISDRGQIASNAKILTTGKIVDVNIGPYAQINNATSLTNGTILSTKEMPTHIGDGVIASDFIFAEAAKIDGRANLEKTYVGQCSKIGDQYLIKDSLVFANCELFGGEAHSIFAGPFTVTHHKSTLLIAGLFSFFNAGSGTNQSNHMYRLGPNQEGKLLRGTKTGSDAYIKWPAVTGPFSIVVGKHTAPFDASAFPFSILLAKSPGQTELRPAATLTSAGLYRDIAKWPQRDARTDSQTDIIRYDHLSPYTIAPMIAAIDQLKSLDFSDGTAKIAGMTITKPHAETAIENYQTAIETYLLEKVIEQSENPAPNAGTYCEKWLDIAGALIPASDIQSLCDDITQGNIQTIDQFNTRIKQLDDNFPANQYAWVNQTYQNLYSKDPETLSPDDLADKKQRLAALKDTLKQKLLADAQKDFAENAKTGFGQDGTDQDTQTDFKNVRGTPEDNDFIKNL